MEEKRKKERREEREMGPQRMRDVRVGEVGRLYEMGE